MAIVRPAITGDIIQDSWADQVTKALNNATLTGTGGSGFGAGSGGGGGGQQGAPGVNGFNAATIYLFQRTETEIAPSTIASATTYTYETGILSADDTGNTGDPEIDGDDIDGWFRVIPNQDLGRYIWTIQVSVADQGGSESISDTTWSAVTLLATQGDSASSMVIQAFAEDASLSQVTDWVSIPSMGISQVSPNFKNDTARVIGLIPTIYEGGIEIFTADAIAATYAWTKNGKTFTPNQTQLTGTGVDERVLLINEMDVADGNVNEVFNCVVDY